MRDYRVNVTKAFLPPIGEYIEKIRPLWNSAWVTNNGCLHEELETRLSHYLKAKYLTLFVNGHSALRSVLRTMELEGEVITTPFSFASTTHAIVQNGLTPVFCDIKESDCTIDSTKIESLITDKTCAILPVHVYGNLCDTYEIEKIAHKHGLKVIYDAAHAFGVEFEGKSVANFGDATMFSFHATKVFNTVEGGAIACDGLELKRELCNERNFGIVSPESVISVGSNYKMSEFHAAMGLTNLPHINEQIYLRKSIWKRYQLRLSKLPGIRLVKAKNGVKANYSYVPVLFDPNKFGKTRDDIMIELAKHNVFARKYFFPLISDYNCYKLHYNSLETPIAKHISSQILTLPIYGSLDLKQVDRICDIISALYVV